MNVRTLFPSPWLSPDDLQGKRFELVIAGFEMARVHNTRTNEEEVKPAISFERATKKMILNKTQAFAIAAIAGSDDTAGWVGKRIAVRVGRARNGKPTIIVEAAAVAVPTPQMDSGETEAVD